MTSVERTLLHDRLSDVEAQLVAREASCRAADEINRTLVRELERVAIELDRATARLDWLAGLVAATFERTLDGAGTDHAYRLVVWPVGTTGYTAYGATIPEAIDHAIDRAGGEEGTHGDA